MLTREGCPRELAISLPKRLTKDYPTHGYAISLDEAAELGLPVKPIAEYEFCEQVLACHEENRASRTDVIEVLNVIDIADEAVVDEKPAPVVAKRKRKSA
jgi:hypothetical protein